MGGHEYRHAYAAHYYDCDEDLQVSVLALMRWFEDIALLQSEDYGVGMEFYAREDVAWLLSRWDIRLHGVLRHRDEVRVCTQPMGMRRFLANRRYDVSTPAGAPVAQAESQWLFIDTKRRRPRRIPEEIFSRYGVQGEVEELHAPQSPAPVERVDAQRDFSVRMSDIDSNGHVNNIRYVEWALEALPQEMLHGSRLVRLLVHYQREVRYGGDVLSRMQRDERDGLQCVRHNILSGDNVACTLESHWATPATED